MQQIIKNLLIKLTAVDYLNNFFLLYPIDNVLHRSGTNGSTLRAKLKARKYHTLLCLDVTYTSRQGGTMTLEPSGSTRDTMNLPVSSVANL
jgi:hypothetical protein